MRLKHLLQIGVVIIQLGLFDAALRAQLLNVDFGSETSRTKVGFAATGQSANDFWNLYSRDDGNGWYRTFGTVSNLKMADGTVSAVGLTVINAPGAWLNGAADPMYDAYLYPFDGGNIKVTMTNLPAGSYDVFLYGHGGPGVDSANSVFQVVSGNSDYGTKATTTTSGWTSPVWQEGQQYVVFRDVAVAGGPVTITVFPGAYGQAFISGMQLVKKASSPPPSVTPFVNGSFELPPLTPGSGQSLPSGSTAITGWTVQGTGVGWQNGASFGVSPVDGAQHIGFNGGNSPPGAGSISQTFTTTAGQIYAVNFNVGRTGSGNGTVSLLAEVTSSTGMVLDSLNAVAPVSPGYGPVRTFSFIATTSASTLTFRDTSSATIAVDPLLDNVSVVLVIACVQPPPGLAGWWKGDGNAADTVLGNNGSLIGGVTFTPGLIGEAFDFNGSDSQISLGNTVGNFDTNDFTVEFWIRTTATRHESVIEKWPTCGYASMWGIRIGSVAPWSGPGRLEAEMYSDSVGTGQNAISAGRPINDGLFHHVALVRYGINLVFYIDGVQDVTTNVISGSISRINNTANLTVGRSVCVGVDGTSPFTGQLDELAVYNRALSALEIQEIYNAGGAGKCPPPPQQPPVAGPLLNVDFGIGTTSAKVGFAATGQSASDFWNLYSRDDGNGGYRTVGAVSNLKRADGTVSAVGLTVLNAPGAWLNGAADPMYDVYLYPFDGGNITVSVTNLPAGSYDVFLYGHGGPGVNSANSVFRVVSGVGDYGTKATTTTSGWTSPVWEEGQQYVVFRDVAVAGGPVTITVLPGAYGQAFISGMQLVQKASASCVAAADGVVSWWPAGGNAADIVGGNNGSLRGNASYGEGKVGQAFKFDGNGDGVVIGNPASLRLQNFTIEGWIRRGSAMQVSNSSIFGEIVGYGWGGYVFGLLSDGRLFLSKHGISDVDSTRPIADTDWHHVAVTKSGTSVVFYIDGTSEATQTYDVTFDFLTDLVIGAVNSAIEASFLGSIDELSIYNRALTAREIQAVHNAASAGKCAPLPLKARALAHWRFDETSGPVAHDSAGSYDGALSINGASFVTNGIAGNALSVTKSANGFVDMGNVLGMESGDFSVTAWIKMIPGDMSQSSVIVSKQRAGYANGYLLAVNRSEGPTGGYAAANKAWFYDSDYHGEEVTSTTSVNEGNWHQIVGVYVAGAAKYIYVDGAPAEARKASRPIVGNPGKFVVGGVDFDGIPGGLFTGLIDEVQIYNYALSSSEVDFLFQNPGQEIAPHDLPPGNWQLNAIAGIGGTISRNPDLAKYTNGAIVTVTAVPNAGFTFSGWSGDASGTSNTTTISMNGNKTVTASFREISAGLLAVVNPEAGQEGASITVPITLTSQGEVGGMSFVLHFDPAYLRNPSLRWASVVGSALNQVGYEIPGQVRATFALPATAVPAGTKLVANVSFMARSVPFTLSTELGLEILDASKTTGDPITPGSYTQSGSAQILVRRAVGDNNANNRLDIGDASIIQRLLTGLDPVRSWDVTGNDVNASSRLDSGDVIRVLRVVVGLDPQPQLQSGATTGSQGLAKSGLQKSGPVPAQVDLSLDKPSAQPGDLVKLQVRLTGIATSIEGAVATLDYPTNALRLLNAQSQRTGSLVPSSALAIWNVAPAQTDYALQSGRVLVAMSSATPWPTNEGVLAEFMFQVQSGQTTQYRWPIRVSNVEVTEGGFDLQSLPDAETYFIGRNSIPPSLSSASSGWSSDGFRLSLDGESGVTYSIEVSSDLVTWLPLTTLTTDTNGTLSFVDESAIGSTKRYYRAKQQ